MKLLLTNKFGNTLDLLNSRNYFVLTKAEGMHGINTDISENSSPFIDGTTIESVRALPRSIDLTFNLVGDIQTALDYFTSFVKSKQNITLTETNDDGRELTIKGVATIPPYSRMLQTCKITLTVYCGQPYWETAAEIISVLSAAIDLLTFPFDGQYFTATGRPFGAIDTSVEGSFINPSDTSVGMLIELLALGSVNSPRITCSSGEQVGWYLQLNLTLSENDLLEINTVRGQKYVTINGSSTYNGNPILNYLEFKGDDWLQLETGSNSFNVTVLQGGIRVTASNLQFSVVYKGRYE